MLPKMAAGGRSSTDSIASMAENRSKNAQKCSYECAMSSVPHISRMECIASCGAPTSSTLQPKLDARMGPASSPHVKQRSMWTGLMDQLELCRQSACLIPMAAPVGHYVKHMLTKVQGVWVSPAPIVDPQAMSLRTENSCVGIPRSLASSSAIHRHATVMMLASGPGCPVLG